MLGRKETNFTTEKFNEERVCHEPLINHQEITRHLVIWEMGNVDLESCKSKRFVHRNVWDKTWVLGIRTIFDNAPDDCTLKNFKGLLKFKFSCKPL